MFEGKPTTIPAPTTPPLSTPSLNAATKQTVVDQDMVELMQRESLSGWQKIALIAAAVIILLLLLGGGIWLYFTLDPLHSGDGSIVQPTNQTSINALQADRDKDNLRDLEEGRYNTNPDNPDSDGDGLTDGEEVKTYHTNPTQADSDSDGLNDQPEVLQHHTNPTNADSDSDGYPDGEEVTNGYDPLGPGKLQ